MPYEVTIMKADGSVKKFTQEKEPQYEQLKKAVGGFIETVPHFHKLGERKRGIAFCNEEGRIKNLPRNDEATKAWLDCLGKGPFRYDPVLYGDVIFFAKVK